MDFLHWFLSQVTRPVFWFQPVFYSVHGWVATEMALWMLFHPYEPIFIPATKLKIPFTPGIFPRGRHKLSVSIANTITDILLTQEDLKKQAERLITPENLYRVVDVLIDSILSELKDITHLSRLYRYVQDIVPPLIEKATSDWLDRLAMEESGEFERLADQILNRLQPKLSLTEGQALQISQTLLDIVLTPQHIRSILIAVLTPETAKTVEATLKKRVSGMQGLMIRFFDLEKGVNKFRDFLVNEPVEADAMLAEVMLQLDLQTKLTTGLMKLSPQQLSGEKIDALKTQLISKTKRILIQHRGSISEKLRVITESATESISKTVLHTDYQTLTAKWLPSFKQDTARFTYTYLNKELENMLSRALPFISLNDVIVAKIDQFSAKELEETIQKICSNELRSLAFLGAFLGFWLGLIANLTSYFLPPLH